jgi:hypothetical protein
MNFIEHSKATGPKQEKSLNSCLALSIIPVNIIKSAPGVV